jgi:hypothetical protein
MQSFFQQYATPMRFLKGRKFRQAAHGYVFNTQNAIFLVHSLALRAGIWNA